MANRDNDSSMFDEFDLQVDPADTKEGTVAKVSKPVAKMLKSTLKGAMSGVTQAVGDRFYDAKDAVDEVVELKDDFKNLASDMHTKGSEYYNTLKKLTLQAMPLGKKLVPDKWYKAIEKHIRETTDLSENREQSPEEKAKAAQTSEITGALDSIFKQQMAMQEAYHKQEVTDKMVDRKIEDVRFRAQSEAMTSLDTRLYDISNFIQNTYTGYLKKDLELKYYNLFVARDTFKAVTTIAKIVEARLEEIKKNTGLPDFVKVAYAKQLPGFSRKFESRNHNKYKSELRQRLMKGIKEDGLGELSSNIEMMLGMMEGMSGFTDMLGPLGITDLISTGLGWGAKHITKKITNKFFDSNKPLEEMIREKTSNMKQRLWNWVEDLGIRWSNREGLLGLIGEHIPRSSEYERVSNPTITNPLESIPFDRITKASIVEVIPAHLSNIGKYIKGLALAIAPNGNYQDITYSHHTKHLESKGKALAFALQQQNLDEKTRTDRTINAMSGVSGLYQGKEEFFKDKNKFSSRKIEYDKPKFQKVLNTFLANHVEYNEPFRRGAFECLWSFFNNETESATEILGTTDDINLKSYRTYFEKVFSGLETNEIDELCIFLRRSCVKWYGDDNRVLYDDNAFNEIERLMSYMIQPIDASFDFIFNELGQGNLISEYLDPVTGKIRKGSIKNAYMLPENYKMFRKSYNAEGKELTQAELSNRYSRESKETAERTAAAFAGVDANAMYDKYGNTADIRASLTQENKHGKLAKGLDSVVDWWNNTRKDLKNTFDETTDDLNGIMGSVSSLVTENIIPKAKRKTIIALWLDKELTKLNIRYRDGSDDEIKDTSLRLAKPIKPPTTDKDRAKIAKVIKETLLKANKDKNANYCLDSSRNNKPEDMFNNLSFSFDNPFATDASLVSDSEISINTSSNPTNDTDNAYISPLDKLSIIIKHLEIIDHTPNVTPDTDTTNINKNQNTDITDTNNTPGAANGGIMGYGKFRRFASGGNTSNATMSFDQANISNNKKSNKNANTTTAQSNIKNIKDAVTQSIEEINANTNNEVKKVKSKFTKYIDVFKKEIFNKDRAKRDPLKQLSKHRMAFNKRGMHGSFHSDFRWFAVRQLGFNEMFAQMLPCCFTISGATIQLLKKFKVTSFMKLAAYGIKDILTLPFTLGRMAVDVIKKPIKVVWRVLRSIITKKNIKRVGRIIKDGLKGVWNLTKTIHSAVFDAVKFVFSKRSFLGKMVSSLTNWGLGAAYLGVSTVHSIGKSIRRKWRSIGFAFRSGKFGFKKYFDVYRKDEILDKDGKLKSPLLTARDQENGTAYFIVNGQPEAIKSTFDINQKVFKTDPIDGKSLKCIITDEDINHGLVDVNNDPITKMFGFGIIKNKADKLRAIFANLGGIGGLIIDGLKSLWKGIFNIGKKAASGALSVVETALGGIIGTNAIQAKQIASINRLDAMLVRLRNIELAICGTAADIKIKNDNVLINAEKQHPIKNSFKKARDKFGKWLGNKIKFARGGFIGGPSDSFQGSFTADQDDSVPALLNNHELVLNEHSQKNIADALSKAGYKVNTPAQLYAFSKGAHGFTSNIRKFAAGGEVSSDNIISSTVETDNTTNIQEGLGLRGYFEDMANSIRELTDVIKTKFNSDALERIDETISNAACMNYTKDDAEKDKAEREAKEKEAELEAKKEEAAAKKEAAEKARDAASEKSLNADEQNAKNAKGGTSNKANDMSSRELNATQTDVTDDDEINAAAIADIAKSSGGNSFIQDYLTMKLANVPIFRRLKVLKSNAHYKKLLGTAKNMIKSSKHPVRAHISKATEWRRAKGLMKMNLTGKHSRLLESVGARRAGIVSKHLSRARRFGGKALEAKMAAKFGVKAAGGGIAKMLGWPLMAAITAAEGIHGWNNTANISNKDLRDITNNDKANAALSSMLSGLTLGLINAKTMNKVVGNKYINPLLSPLTGTIQAVGAIGSGVTKAVMGNKTSMDPMEIARARTKFERKIKSATNPDEIAELRQKYKCFNDAIIEQDWAYARELAEMKIDAGTIGRDMAETIIGSNDEPMTDSEVKSAIDKFEDLLSRDNVNKSAIESQYNDFKNAIEDHDWRTARRLSGKNHWSKLMRVIDITGKAEGSMWSYFKTTGDYYKIDVDNMHERLSPDKMKEAKASFEDTIAKLEKAASTEKSEETKKEIEKYARVCKKMLADFNRHISKKSWTQAKQDILGLENIKTKMAFYLKPKIASYNPAEEARFSNTIKKGNVYLRQLSDTITICYVSDTGTKEFSLAKALLSGIACVSVNRDQYRSSVISKVHEKFNHQFVGLKLSTTKIDEICSAFLEAFTYSDAVIYIDSEKAKNLKDAEKAQFNAGKNVGKTVTKNKEELTGVKVKAFTLADLKARYNAREKKLTDEDLNVLYYSCISDACKKVSTGAITIAKLNTEEEYKKIIELSFNKNRAAYKTDENIKLFRQKFPLNKFIYAVNQQTYNFKEVQTVTTNGYKLAHESDLLDKQISENNQKELTKNNNNIFQQQTVLEEARQSDTIFKQNVLNLIHGVKESVDKVDKTTENSAKLTANTILGSEAKAVIASTDISREMIEQSKPPVPPKMAKDLAISNLNPYDLGFAPA